MLASLKLPFNLLNLESLQKIKISSIPYPFNLYKAPTMSKKETMNSNNSDLLSAGDTSSQRSESLYDMILEDEEIREFKVFNLTGAKFGRSPENDFSYPDELSISGRHAQIIFKDESYYIRDLGSKTGTFVYISERKPLVLSDEQLVQLSYEVESKVIIIKNVSRSPLRTSTRASSSSSSRSRRTSRPTAPSSKTTTRCASARRRTRTSSSTTRASPPTTRRSSSRRASSSCTTATPAPAPGSASPARASGAQTANCPRWTSSASHTRRPSSCRT